MFEIFLVTAPGLESVLADEARDAGFDVTGTIPGGVSLMGGWPDVWRANLSLRGATRVLARFAEFLAFHPAQLDKRARKVDWASVLRPDVPVRVDVTTKKSKIYHAGAAQSRIETAITETVGAPIAKDAPVQVKARIEDNVVTLSVDTSGESLHKRGFKEAMAKAPMRETLAAQFLRAAGYTGTEPVLDPMCGSGTFVIEAAEIAAGLAPGRERAFGFEQLASFDAAAWATMKAAQSPRGTDLHFYGSDRDPGAVKSATTNAARAGLADLVTIAQHPVSEVQRPDGPPGLVIVNPPYGARIGNQKLLYALYGSFGKVMQERFRGWRVAIITTDGGLAKATGLDLSAGPPIDHGGLRVKLYQTGPL